MTQRLTAAQRLYSAVLFLAIALGAIAVWSLVPFGTLWALSRFADDGTELLVLALLGVPSAMIGFAALLGRINAAYVALHRPLPRADADGGGDGEGDWTPRVRGPLEQMLTFAPVAAFIGFALWFALRPGPPFHL